MCSDQNNHTSMDVLSERLKYRAECHQYLYERDRYDDRMVQRIIAKLATVFVPVDNNIDAQNEQEREVGRDRRHKIDERRVVEVVNSLIDISDEWMKYAD